ncbi:hypothetical protein [Rhodoferax sp. PAMC 29310]|uniref:hypothetical protein n=1 Tax=Rhodoferax sp. PAMC 29310 TaxID=2822760 RepID=UPI001B32D241|nr:hypothetical protein [Rhodoferax sp. PAMC 29310]
MQPINKDHQTIVAALARVPLAANADLIPHWSHLISAMESQLVKTGLVADNGIFPQHATVFPLMREGEARAHRGNHVVRQMADQLGAWPPQHGHRHGCLDGGTR